MNPITGPYITELYAGEKWEFKSSYRQKRPYTLNLPFVVRKGFCRQSFPDPNPYAWSAAVYAEELAGSAALYAKAYSRLVDKLGENAGMGVDLSQWKQADNMIRKRGNDLLGFTDAVFRRNPLGIARSLGIKASRAQIALHPKYRGAKGISNLWLEFWFGWKPLVQDIYAACEVFDNFIPWAHLEGSASSKCTHEHVPYPFSSGHYMSGKRACKVGIDVRLVNPNVRLMQQFGILNPAVVAWDLVPWSFVIDWFANVNQWLASFTDFAGFETSNGYVTKFCAINGRFYWHGYPYGGPATGVYMSRSLSTTLPRPRLHLKGWSMSPTRGLTAISLLTQKLPSK